MKLHFSALLGVFLAYSLNAQITGGDTAGITTNDPVKAAEEAQRQAQFAYENQLAELNNSANQAKEGLLSRRTALNRELSQCFMQKNEADITAQQQADQQTQQATNQLIQGAQQGLTPIFQNAGQANSLGKEAAQAQREGAVNDQRLAVDLFARDCGETAVDRLKFKGVYETDKSILQSIDNQTKRFIIDADPAKPKCSNSALNLKSTSNSALTQISQAKQADASAGMNWGSIIGAAATLGIGYYGYNQGKKAAEAGLEDANRLNGMSYDACQQGVRDEAAEIDRQLANIDKQLAADRARLAQQFAQFKLNIPPNIQNKNGIPVEDDNFPNVGSLGGSVSATNLAGPANPFSNLNKNGGGSGAGAGAGAAGGGAGAGGGDDGKVGWGFRDPYETNNPGLAYTLPNQPEKAGLIGGVDGFEGGGGSGNPFGDGFLGFEDPFGNLAGANGAALAADQGGNGFIELALKTRRRVYAHLSELLGKPNEPKIGKTVDKKPERKISSVRE